MKSEYIENHKTAELGIIYEEKAVCNQPLSETLFRGSIIFYKIQIIQVRGQCIHVFVVRILLYVLHPLFAYLNCRFYIFFLQIWSVRLSFLSRNNVLSQSVSSGIFYQEVHMYIFDFIWNKLILFYFISCNLSIMPFIINYLLTFPSWQSARTDNKRFLFLWLLDKSIYV